MDRRAKIRKFKAVRADKEAKKEKGQMMWGGCESKKSKMLNWKEIAVAVAVGCVVVLALGALRGV